MRKEIVKVEKDMDSDENDLDFGLDDIRLQKLQLDQEKYIFQKSRYKALHILSKANLAKKEKLAEILIHLIEANMGNQANNECVSDNNVTLERTNITYQELEYLIDSIMGMSNKERLEKVTQIVIEENAILSEWARSTGFCGDKSHIRMELLRKGCQKMHLLGLDEFCIELFGNKRYKRLLMTDYELDEWKKLKIIRKEEHLKLGVKKLDKKAKRELRFEKKLKTS